jgi:hypothetical protein
MLTMRFYPKANPHSRRHPLFEQLQADVGILLKFDLAFAERYLDVHHVVFADAVCVGKDLANPQVRREPGGPATRPKDPASHYLV